MAQTYLSFEVLPNGDLKITLTPEGKEELQERVESDTEEELRFSVNSDMLWWDFIESHSTNGSYEMVRPEHIGALTDAPIIGLGMVQQEEGDPFADEETKVWWYPNYMISDPLEVLLKHGEVIFQSGDNS